MHGQTGSPVFNRQPQDQTLLKGASLILTADAKGRGPAGSLVTSGVETNVLDTGRTSGTLYIDYQFYSLPDNLRVYYQNNLIFDSGLVQAAGTFNVPYGPGASSLVTIVMNETNQYPGTVWEYTVSTGVPVSYQWWKDGSAIPGAMVSSLTINNAALTNAGTYSVVASNQFGITNSAPARVTVLDMALSSMTPGGPAFVSQPSDATVFSGSAITLNVNAGSPAKNGYMVATSHFSGSDTNLVDVGQTNGSFRIDYDFWAIPDQLFAYYEGQPIYSSGFLSGSGSFNISYGPGASSLVSIVMNPTNEDNGTAWLYTVWTSLPLSYQWLKNGASIPGGPIRRTL